MSFLNTRSRDHGSSPRNRVAESKVAPPQTSMEWNPIAFMRSAMGTMSSVRKRVAIKLWCASRKVVSVMPRGLVILCLGEGLEVYFRIFNPAEW